MANPKKKPWLAGLLSFFVTGMGQIYNRQYKKGIILFISNFTLIIILEISYLLGSQINSGQTSVSSTNIFLGFLIILLPFILWFYSIFDAYKNAKGSINKEPNIHAIWITVIIFIIILSSLSFTWFAGVSSSLSTSYVPTGIQSENTSTYANNAYKFSILLPKDYYAKEGCQSGNITYIVCFYNRNANIMAFVSYFDLGYDATSNPQIFNQTISSLIDGIKSSGVQNFRIISQGSQILNGNNAYYINWVATTNGITAEAYTALIFKGTSMYSVSFASPESIYNQYFPDFQNSLGTFSFI